jgi:hypothetical protein
MHLFHRSLFQTGRILAVVALTLGAAACEKKEKTRDVQYYLDHPDKRQQKLAECRNNPGEKALTPNCVNAGQAAHKAMFQGTEMPKLRSK